MAIEEINEAINGFNKIILRLCLTAITVVLIITIGSCINSRNQSKVAENLTETLKFYIQQSYDYDYPDIENTNISGNDNNIQGAD